MIGGADQWYYFRGDCGLDAERDVSAACHEDEGAANPDGFHGRMSFSPQACRSAERERLDAGLEAIESVLARSRIRGPASDVSKVRSRAETGEADARK
jgi:hypothetical protein